MEKSNKQLILESYKLSKVAKDLKVTKVTLWNWMHDGKIDFIKDETNGFNYISKETYNNLMGIQERESNKVVIYSRVSSHEQKDDMKRQSERLISYVNAKGWKVHAVIEEIGSGFNDKRPRLKSLLNKGDFDILVIEHKDRLTRCGFNWMHDLLMQMNKKIEVVNEVDTDEKSLIEDFVSIITSYAARIYGQRRSTRKSEEIIEFLKK